ncbi:MAG: TIGR04086 family membrane protein [Bacillota bacterium]
MKDKTNKTYILDISISTVLGMIFTILGIVIFSLVLNFFDIPSGVISPVNQAIKFLGVLLGVFIGVSNKKAGLVKGLVSGVLCILLLFLMFSGIGGSVVFTKYTAIDLACGGVVGMIAGVFAVNLKKDRKS